MSELAERDNTVQPPGEKRGQKSRVFVKNADYIWTIILPNHQCRVPQEYSVYKAAVRAK